MIRAVMPNQFGKWLKAARLSSEDPLTGLPYTQERLGELMNISSSKVAAWERGQIASISPDDAHNLARVLKREEWEILEQVGYQVGEQPLLQEEKELLSIFRQLPPVHKTLEKERLRTLLPLLLRTGTWLERGPNQES